MRVTLAVVLAATLPVAWLLAAEGPPKSHRPPEAEAAVPQEPSKSKDWGEPLLDHAEQLKRLDPVAHIWLDVKQKQVVLMGETCQADYPLEFFATLHGREYEAIVVVDAKPRLVHAGLLAVGASPGHPASYEPTYGPPSGTEVAILVRWKDKGGRRQEARAQDWIRDVKTKKPLELNWVFAGSGITRDPETGRTVYLADSGDFISVANGTSATLDLPIKSPSGLESRLFERAADRMPAKGTPVTILLRPKAR
jgi:hypothetical protein